MRNTILYRLLIGSCVAILTACQGAIPPSKPVQEVAVLFPDYADATIPANIAPLNFSLTNPHTEAYALLQVGQERLQLKERGGQFTIPPADWQRLVGNGPGQWLSIQLFARADEWVAFPTCSLRIAPEPIDPFIAYRLIEPGYELWNQMGIYQRQLGSYAQTAIMENVFTDQNCMNCHSFCMQDPDRFLFHMRDKHSGTYLVQADRIEKLNTKTDQTLSALVYPSWHPSGRYVAFSVNQTQQSFHANDKNRVEVFDSASDVVVYDVERHEVLSAPELSQTDAFETFPTFSPDGQTLYFCSAEAKELPADFKQVKYSLCSVDFDPQRRTFGSQVDTLYSAADEGLSASFPRVSPDGRWLLYTLSGYGNFSIWHKDADLHLIDLRDKSSRPLTAANSDDVESYHSWSSNSRWIVFSSRRLDGLYTRPYFAYVNAEGQVGKPFLLPQKETDYYLRLMKSYNIPEFITGQVKNRIRSLSRLAKDDPGIDVRFAR